MCEKIKKNCIHLLLRFLFFFFILFISDTQLNFRAAGGTKYGTKNKWRKSKSFQFLNTRTNPYQSTHRIRCALCSHIDSQHNTENELLTNFCIFFYVRCGRCKQKMAHTFCMFCVFHLTNRSNLACFFMCARYRVYSTFFN